MDSYSVYTRFYDATQGIPDGSAYLRLLRKHHPDASTLLELGCGTGAHLQSLAKHYSVVGLDSSPSMLRFARRRLPGIHFTRQDMSDFRLKQKFDAIVIPFDSINHLLKFRDWVRTFRNSRRHLQAGGVLIFDVNTAVRLHELVDADPWVLRFNGNYVIMDVTKSKGRVTDWDIKVFERLHNRSFRLHHQVIQESAFDHAQILRALRIFFSKVRGYDGSDWARPRKSSRRLFYVCHAST